MKPDAILTADWHLRLDNPECRTEKSFFKTLLGKLKQIRDIQRRHQVPILLAGDMTHRWYVDKRPSLIPYFFSKTAQCMPHNIQAIPGQHDMPEHNYSELRRSAFYAFVRNGLIDKGWRKHSPVEQHSFNLYGFPFGFRLRTPDINLRENNVAMIHTLTYKGRKPFPGKIPGVTKVMDKLKGFDLILCGDNHKPFTHKRGDQLFVSPGSISRQTADQVDHRPRVYLWFAETNTVEKVYLKVEDNVSREHIETRKVDGEQINEFVKKLRTNFEVSMNFERNMETVIRKNKLKKRTILKIRQAMEGVDE